MNDDFVGMGHETCPICGVRHTETVLIHRQFGKVPKDSCTGLSLCPEHAAMTGEFLALVEAEAPTYGTTLRPETAKRTGNIAHIKWDAADAIFNVPIDRKHVFVYVEPGVIDKLKSMQAP